MGRVSSIHHHKRGAAVKMTCTPSSRPPPKPINVGEGVLGRVKKRRFGSRLWTRFDRTGAMEVVVCDKTTIIKRASITARDLRTAFSDSSKILGREKAIIVNLEAIKAIITAEEVLLLEPLCPEVSTLIQRLKQQFPQKDGLENALQASSHGLDDSEGAESLESELPFEFQVLEIALEVFCSFIDSNVAAFETQAWSLLEELTNKVSAGNLKTLLSVKRNLTCLLARVQKVKDEIETLLDDKENMADLYLTRKWIQNQQPESIHGSTASKTSNLHRLTVKKNSNRVTEEDDVDDLEMLLESYFIQLEIMRNKILMMKEHIHNTEDYVKILERSRRNGLIELKLKVEIANFAITAGTIVVNVFGMNIHIPWYDIHGIFGYVVWSVAAFCIMLFMVILGYAKRNMLLD